MVPIDFLYPFQFNSQPMRSHALGRFCRSLESAFKQSYPIRVCICDLSLEPIFDRIKERFPENKFAYFHHPYKGIFSPGKARNVGVRKLVESEWLILSDIDMLYPYDYVQKLIKVPSQPPLLWACRQFFSRLPVVRVTSRFFSLDQFGKITGAQDAPGNGLVKTSVYHQVRGMPETIGYGPEDQHFNQLVTQYGLFIIGYNLGINTPSHIWHPAVSPRVQTKKNTEEFLKIKPLLHGRRFRKGRIALENNIHGWGELG